MVENKETDIMQRSRDYCQMLADNLRSKCHTSECIDKKMCPKRCVCAKEVDLNLETAIGWQVAELVDDALHNGISQRHIDRIDVLHDVLMNHVNEYASLFAAVDTILTEIEWLHDTDFV